MMIDVCGKSVLLLCRLQPTALENTLLCSVQATQKRITEINSITFSIVVRNLDCSKFVTHATETKFLNVIHGSYTYSVTLKP